MPSFGQSAELEDPFEGMHNPKRLLREARWTDAQLEQIRELRRPTRPLERAIEKEIQALTKECEHALTAEGPIDSARMLFMVEKIHALNAQLDVMKAKSLIHIRALLTQEQMARVAMRSVMGSPSP